MNDVGLIVTAVIGLIGAIITTQLWQNNWVKRETFKLQKSNVLAENRIKMRKLEKDLGITSKGNPIPAVKDQGSIVELLKGLDRDKIEDILGMLQGSDEDAPAEGGIASLLDNLPPGVVDGFLQGIQKKNESAADPGVIYHE